MEHDGGEAINTIDDGLTEKQLRERKKKEDLKQKHREELYLPKNN